jgi:hypothetical protein
MDPERCRRVEQLYHSAAELDSEHWDTFLAEACRGDQELQKDVHSLLTQGPLTAELLGGSLSSLAGESLGDCPGKITTWC